MYLQDLWTSCVRRWPLVIAALVVTAGIVLGASTVVKPTYQASASMVLVPPVNPSEPTENRYLGLGGLKQSADVLARSMKSAETTRAIEALAPAGSYQIDPDVASTAPILVVNATGATSAGAERMLAATLDQLPLNLQLLQESVDIKTPNQITRVMVSRDEAPEAVQKLRLRILGFLTACLLILGALALGIADGVLLRRGNAGFTPKRRPAPPGVIGPPAGQPSAASPRPHQVAPTGQPPSVPQVLTRRYGTSRGGTEGGDPSSNGHDPGEPTSP